MLEVFTIGGGEYVVNVLNAVAAWTGGGGYRSLLRVVMVMGLAYSLCVVAFSLDWRAWLNWFLQSTAIYMMLMVPTVTVKVGRRQAVRQGFWYRHTQVRILPPQPTA
jgi:conjugal transfer mating pair stabilization protein TraG